MKACSSTSARYAVVSGSIEANSTSSFPLQLVLKTHPARWPPRRYLRRPRSRATDIPNGHIPMATGTIPTIAKADTAAMADAPNIAATAAVTEVMVVVMAAVTAGAMAVITGSDALTCVISSTELRRVNVFRECVGLSLLSAGYCPP